MQSQIDPEKMPFKVNDKKDGKKNKMNKPGEYLWKKSEKIKMLTENNRQIMV